MATISLYKQRTGKTVFDIKCSKFENTLPSMMPSRKFNQKSLSWRAPIIRLNVEYLRRNRKQFHITPDAEEALNNFKVQATGGNAWPDDYPFKLTPKPHQLECLKYTYPVANPGIICDIGTGKTKVAIDTACCRYFENKISKVLVIVLMSIKHNWADEIKLNSPVPTNIHSLDTSTAGKKRFAKFLEEDGFRWVIVAIESFSNGSAFDLCKEFVDDETMIIIDESDSIKNYSAIRTERCIELSEMVTYRMIMTGTPILQGTEDFFAQFEFLDPNIIGIGDFYSFKNRYCVMGGHDSKMIIGYQRMDELIQTLKPYIFQVRKRDVLKDLPESTYQTRLVNMSKEQSELYANLKSDLRALYNNRLLSVKNVLNLMQRFSEITGGFYSYIDLEEMAKIPETELTKTKYRKDYLKSNPKADELMAFLEPLPQDEPVIIWAISKMEVQYLVNRVGKVYGPDSIVQMHGGVSEDDRHIGLQKFTSGQARFLIGNQSVGGIGLNMTNCCIMCYFSNDFSLRKRVQSEGRIERLGQTRPMLFMDFCCRGSIDMYVASALQGKLDFAESIRSAFDHGTLEDLL